MISVLKVDAFFTISGDSVVVVSTDFDWKQAELRTITAVSGNEIDLDGEYKGEDKMNQC